jgi:hypothetical protein
MEGLPGEGELVRPVSGPEHPAGALQFYCVYGGIV